MGLRMEDLHAPTVASGPTTGGASANGVPLERLSLMELIKEKEKVEAQMSALSSVLDSHGVNMNTSLTTFDGYPRDDIDVAQVRTTRASIIRLRNDYKELMRRIEDGLHKHHAGQAANTSSSNSASAGSSLPTRLAQSRDTPFAKVNTVAPGGPAETAGLRVADVILRFGSVNASNHEKLSKVAEVVSQSEGQSIPVKLRRPDGADVELQLVPRRDWGGRGLLGCHLLPL